MYRQHECCTDPFQVYFQTPREVSKKIYKVINYPYIQILKAIWTCFQCIQMALTCVWSVLLLQTWSHKSSSHQAGQSTTLLVDYTTNTDSIVFCTISIISSGNLFAYFTTICTIVHATHLAHSYNQSLLISSVFSNSLKIKNLQTKVISGVSL